MRIFTEIIIFLSNHGLTYYEELRQKWTKKKNYGSNYREYEKDKLKDDK